MEYENSIQRYRYWYAKLLRFYSKPYYERFGEGMEQTFSDLLRERAEEERVLLSFAFWMYIDTFTGIIKEKIKFTNENARILEFEKKQEEIVEFSDKMLPLCAV